MAGISIEVRHGEFYSLLGPSGCGKTTTLRLVAGFERPDEGRILIAGQDVTALPPHRRGTNTVFQHYALFPHMTVEQNVAYGLRQKRLPRQEVEDRLERGLATVRLADLRRRKPRELSGGQQQRVALARALVNEPTVLLLDEPLAALDQKLRKAMHGELKVLQERVGITFLYVTHDQEEALTLSDRIAVMNQGAILQEGTPQEIYERPTTRFVADFIGLTNFFEGEVVEAGPTTVVRDGSGHVLRCAGVPWASLGMRVSVGVRPENLDIANGDDPAPAGENRVGGTVTRRTYLGDLVQYRVMLRGGQEVLCQVQNARGEGAECGPGDAVELAWEERHALVLAEERSDPAQHEDLRLVNEETPRPSRPRQEQPTA